MRGILAFVIGIFCFLPICNSQTVEFEHLTTEDGLSSNVNAILKDSYGFMWFGSYGGLKRYDGYSFTSYNHNPKDTLSLSDDYVRCLLESKDKVLYVGLEFHGFCIFNRETETFTRFKHDPHNPNSLSHDYVLTIYEDKRGNIWIGTREGLDRFDYKTRSFTHYNPYNHATKKSFVTSITEDEKGNLWIYGMSNRICKFDPVNNTTQFIQFTDKEIDKVFVHGGEVEYDSKGNIWIGNDEVGLIRLDPRTGAKESFTAQLKSDAIFSILEDSDGNIWVGTDGGGLYRYDYKDNRITCYDHVALDPRSISSNAVFSIYESEPGIIWVGTFSSGCNIYKKHKRKFNSYTSLGDDNKRLSHKSVLAVTESPDGKIWVGTDGGGLNLFDPEKKSIKVYNEQNSALCGNVVKTLLIDSDKNLWVGTYSKGLCKIDLQNWKETIYLSDDHDLANTLPSNHIWTLYETRDKKIWIGLIGGGGVAVYDKSKNAFSGFVFDSVETRKYANCNVFAMLEDSKGRVWIGTEALGLICYTPATGKIEKIVHEEDRTSSLSNNNIRDIFEDSQGNIWITTIKGGLNKLMNLEKKEFINYTVDEGLPTNELQDILEDDHHNLWISTLKGLSLFKVKENKFINFDAGDGLAGKEFNFQASCKSKSGYLYFGGIDGITIFHPDSIKYNSVPPRVMITDFKISNRSVNLDRVHFKRPVYLSGVVHLLPEDNVFSLDFAAISYVSPKKNRFAYKLEGFDKEFTYVDSDKRFATYTNLNPGEYVFHVIACNNDGIWNNEGALLKIIVHPPWYKTWWFRISLILSFLWIIMSFYLIRIRAVKRRNILLQKQVEARTLSLKEANERLMHKQQELEQLNNTKNRFFSIIAHDLKNPVNASVLLTKMLKQELTKIASPQQNEIIDHVVISSERIKNLVVNLLEWARTQSRTINIDPVKIPLLELVLEVIHQQSEQARLKEVSIVTNIPMDTCVCGDKNMVTSIIRNILNNSIKYSPRGGTVKVSAGVHDQLVQIAIEDRGIGMPPEILNKLFMLDKNPSRKGTDGETGSGLGLIICHEFAKLNNGRIHAVSEDQKGSTFFFEIQEG